MGQAINVAEFLRIEANPFVPRVSGARMGRPLQTALGEVIRQIGLETPLVVVAGSAGTGKTLLANMATRACSDMGLRVHRLDRGDLMDGAAGERCDVLLVDEADSMKDSTLRMFLPGGGKRPATTTVLLCRPSSLRRFNSLPDAAVVELTRLSLSDTRVYLLERASSTGRSDLFAPSALDLIVDGSRGIPRSLWSIASFAYFSAVSDGSWQIGHQHAVDALASQLILPEIQDAATPSTTLVTLTGSKSPGHAPASDPSAGSLQISLQQVAEILAPQSIRPEIQDAATRGTPLDTPAETRIETPGDAPASDSSDDSWQISYQRLARASASQFAFPEVEHAATPSTPPDSRAVETRIESAGDAPAPDLPPLNLVRADVAIEGNPWRLVAGTIAFAVSFAFAVAVPAFLLLENDSGATTSSRPPVTVLVPRPLGLALADPIRPVLSSASVANNPLTANTAADDANAATKTAASAPAIEQASQSPIVAKSADRVKTTNGPAVRVQTAIAAGAAKEAAKEPPAQAIAPHGIGNQGTITKEAVDQAAAANEAAQIKAAQQAADQAKAAKEAADRAKAAQEAADQAKTANEAAEQAKAAKDAAAQANAAVLRAKIAKDAADRVNAAMQAAAQAQLAARAEAAEVAAAKEAANRERRRFYNSLRGVRE